MLDPQHFIDPPNPREGLWLSVILAAFVVALVAAIALAAWGLA